MSPVISYTPNPWNVRHLAPAPADFRPLAKPQWTPAPTPPRFIRKRVTGSHSPGLARPDHHFKPDCPHTVWVHNGPERIKCRNCVESRRVKDRKVAERIIRGELPIPPKYKFRNVRLDSRG